jgi:hypothetical protein
MLNQLDDAVELTGGDEDIVAFRDVIRRALGE